MIREVSDHPGGAWDTEGFAGKLSETLSGTVYRSRDALGRNASKLAARLDRSMCVGRSAGGMTQLSPSWNVVSPAPRNAARSSAFRSVEVDKIIVSQTVVVTRHPDT